MSDVAQILGLAAPAPGTPHGAAAVASELDKLKPGGTPSNAAARAKSSKQKKLSGMQREVLELLESTHRVNHALYPGLSKLSLQQKWKQHKAPAVKWRRKPFRNPARAELAGESDANGLTLTHWVKAHVEPSDYVFARFNATCDVTRYTDDEYTHALATHDDPQMKWTKAETDELLRLCARFDLRWIVIADRYNAHAAASGTAARSVEDIKYRYYEVTRLLGAYRDRVAAQQAAAATAATAATAAAPDATLASPAIKLESTGAAESTAASEFKPLTGAAATTSTGSSTIVPPVEPSKPVPAPTPTQVLAAAPSPATLTTTATTSDASYRFNVAYEKQRKRQLELAFTRSIEEESEIRRLGDALKSAEAQLKKVAVKVDAKKRKELADVPFEIARALPTGVLLRSSLLALPPPKHGATATTGLSSKLVKKMELLLDELGVPVRPMPTKASCELFDSLRKDAVGLLSLRKHVAAKHAEAQALRDRYKSLTGKDFQPVSTPVRRSERRGDAGTGAAAGATASGASGSSSAATPAGPGGQGKALKHSEKAFRTATKRRGAGASPGVPSKRNKKMP